MPAQCAAAAAIDAGTIDAFARLMNERLDIADTNARKGYIRSIIDVVEVDDNAIRIIGSKYILQLMACELSLRLRGRSLPSSAGVWSGPAIFRYASWAVFPISPGGSGYPCDSGLLDQSWIDATGHEQP